MDEQREQQQDERPEPTSEVADVDLEQASGGVLLQGTFQRGFARPSVNDDVAVLT